MSNQNVVSMPCPHSLSPLTTRELQFRAMVLLHNVITGHDVPANDDHWVIVLSDQIQVGWTEGDHLVMVNIMTGDLRPFTVPNETQEPVID